MLHLSVLLIGIFACHSEPTKIQQSDTAIESIGEIPIIQGNWDQSGYQFCERPQENVQYRDASQDFGYRDQAITGESIEGGMALHFFQNEWWIWQIIPPKDVQAWSQNGEMFEIEANDIPVRLQLLDIDQDGEKDLILTGEYLEIIWSVMTDHQVQEVIVEQEFQKGVHDMGVIDYDSDGDLDLWYFRGYTDALSNNISGQILPQIAPRQFGNLIPLMEDEYFGAPFDAVVLDWDNDLDPDLYICNDFGYQHGGNSILLNQKNGWVDGDALGSNIVDACMGTSIADINNDGWLDMYMSITGGQRFLEGSINGFIEATEARHFPIAENIQMLWGSQIIDFNNDGLFDILVGTSDFSRLGSAETSKEYPIWLIQQTAPNVYEEVGATYGLNQETLSRVVLAYDINQDGIQDLIASDASRLAHVYLSRGCTSNHWLEVSGPSDSLVTVTAGDYEWKYHLTETPGFGASMPSLAHFGLGVIETVDKIQIQVYGEGIYVMDGPISTNQQVTLLNSNR